ncbi:MAG: intradiol ring-cleavage dioxygenase, partial [Quisquiliibacterium sp.]
MGWIWFQQVRALGDRRRALLMLPALAALCAPLRAQARQRPTPALAEGPFYPERFSAAPRQSLLLGPIDGVVPLHLHGVVHDLAGSPLAGARVEIWQCDSMGHYHHSRDSQPGQRDPGFAGFGWMLTDAQGRYGFDTIRPVPYPGRTPHIHVAVLQNGLRRLVTQVFIGADRSNAQDFLYRRLERQDQQA